ncbi:MAG: globin [Microthrixaceae bacterium]
MAVSPMGPPRRTPEPTLFEAVGGEPFFVDLVDRFYGHVAAIPELIAIYPDREDLSGARDRLRLFLVQYWGGPATYSEERGHPRLRMRHAPFVVDVAQRDNWLAAMRAALDDMAPDPAIDTAMWDYFTAAAEAMRNHH